MIKKILSILIAFTFLISSGGAHISANEYDIVLSPSPQKYKTKTKPVSGTDRYTKYFHNKIVQKAFLAALICSLGMDLEVIIHKPSKKIKHNFTVTKANNLNIHSSVLYYHNSQISGMLNILKTKRDYEFEVITRGNSDQINSAKINGYFLNQTTILNIGEEVLKLICEQKPKKSSCQSLNLTNDPVFRQRVLDILGKIAYPDSNSNEFKFFELPSNFNSLEPVTNRSHLSYLKEFPQKLSEVIACYNKTFLIGLLSTSENLTVIRKLGPYEKRVSPDCIPLYKVDNVFFNRSKTPSGIISNLVGYINYIFRPEKLRVGSLQIGTLIPTTVTINNQISLNENDIFNLGKRFYNLFYDLNYDYITRSALHNHFCLNTVTEFTEGVKKIFKEYTGQDLPDLN